jgi:hypothetical protein
MAMHDDTTHDGGDVSMNRFMYLLFSALAVAGVGIANGQATPNAAQPNFLMRQADVGVAIAGQFTTTPENVNTPPAPHQATTDSPAVLATFRDHPFSWFGLEVNYQYTQLSERYFLAAPSTTAPQVRNIPTNFHEATAAYLFHLKTRRHLSPYVALGGGAVVFEPTFSNTPNEWRGAGLADVGFDMQTSSRLGFRLGGRALVYQAPDYQQAAYSQSQRWVATTEPYAGVYVRF